MNKLIPLLILIASTSFAEELYLEVNENLARVNVTNVEEAVTILPEVVAEIEATNYTAAVHKHCHEEDPSQNKPCEVHPLANDEDVVIVEEELTEAQSRTKLPTFLAMVYTSEADAMQKAHKMKQTRWLKDKPTKEIREKRKKKEVTYRENINDMLASATKLKPSLIEDDAIRVDHFGITFKQSGLRVGYVK